MGSHEFYLPPHRDNIPAMTPAEDATRFVVLGGVKGWVGLSALVYLYVFFVFRESRFPEFSAYVGVVLNVAILQLDLASFDGEAISNFV